MSKERFTHPEPAELAEIFLSNVMLNTARWTQWIFETESRLFRIERAGAGNKLCRARRQSIFFHGTFPWCAFFVHPNTFAIDQRITHKYEVCYILRYLKCNSRDLSSIYVGLICVYQIPILLLFQLLYRVYDSTPQIQKWPFRYSRWGVACGSSHEPSRRPGCLG